MKNKLDYLKRQFEAIIAQIRSNPSSYGGFLDPSKVLFDFSPAWVPAMLKSNNLHDADYFLFSYLNPLKGLILDIGANWGYSVGSIRATKCRLPILSIEAQPTATDCLRAIKEIEGTRYDFYIAALGYQERQVEFFTPVVNGVTISALTSASVENLNSYLVNNIISHVSVYRKEADLHRAAFLKFDLKMIKLDTLLRNERFDVSPDPVVAIKIDVEGLEGDVLEGASETIARHRPLLIVEGGNRYDRMNAFIKRNGYVAFKRDDLHLVLDNDITQGINGIFINSGKIEVYEQVGLVRTS